MPYRRRSVAPRLPQSVYNAFKYGNPKRFGGDLHAQASWAIGRAVFNGMHDVDEVIELLTLPGNANGAGAWWWRRVEHPDPSRCSSVSRMRRDVERKIANNLAAWRTPILDAAQARLVIGELYDRAIDAEWHGRTATADRKVYIAHCRMALEAGHIADYGASIRQLAIEANVTKATARTATERLLAAGAIKRVHRSQARSSRWRLVRSWGDKLVPCDLGTEEVVAGGDFVPPSHPAFAHGSGLHYPTWLALREDDTTPREITESLGRHGKDAVRQTRHRLAKLEAAGLARAGDDGWYRIGTRKTLDAIALERGTTKRMNARRDRYKAESREYRAGHLLGQELVHALKAGSRTTDELVAALASQPELLERLTEHGPVEPQVRAALDDMRSRDYIARLPDGRWALVQLVDPAQAPLTAKPARPLEVLVAQIRAELEHGARTERELAIALTARTADVREAIGQLQSAGVAWRPRGRTWSLTPDALPSPLAAVPLDA